MKVRSELRNGVVPVNEEEVVALRRRWKWERIERMMRPKQMKMARKYELKTEIDLMAPILSSYSILRKKNRKKNRVCVAIPHRVPRVPSFSVLGFL